MWSRPFVSFLLYYILSTLLYTMTLLKRLSSEFKHDTWYHIAISVAVLLKLIFLLSAIIVFYGSETHNTDTPFFRKMVKLKDICNQCSIILVCAIMIYLFNPSNKHMYIDVHTQTLLFAFAIIVLLESHWVVFMREQHYGLSIVQFFIGRIGTLNEQKIADRTHIAKHQ